MKEFFVEKMSSLHGSDFLFGAHHPHCDRYNHHLIYLFGHPFCLGCFGLYTGIVAGGMSTILIDWQSINMHEWMLIHLLPIIPAFVQIKVNIKIFKLLSRHLCNPMQTCHRIRFKPAG